MGQPSGSVQVGTLGEGAKGPVSPDTGETQMELRALPPVLLHLPFV